jgi:DNA-directed RNA polymerase I, II, and III subunit RPABC2
MSSYFDNQYGGEDEDFKEEETSDTESSSSEEPSDDESVAQEIHGENDNENENEVDNEDEDEDEDEDDDETIEDDDDNDEVQEGGDGDDGDEEKQDETKSKRVKKIPAKTAYKNLDIGEDSDEDDDNDGEMYLQKFDKAVNNNYILNHHPESMIQNYDEILAMTKVLRDDNGIIIDDLHRTIPYLTKYEKARILGQRAKQINAGAHPFIKVPENVIDGYIIAELELKEKRIPFIIRRPLPNGGSEYWSLKDLEDLSF